MRKKAKLGEDLRVDEETMDSAGAEVAASGLEKHGFVETAPDVLGSVNEVLDAGGEGEGAGAGGITGRGRRGAGLRVRGEGGEGGGDKGEVGGDGVAGRAHKEDGVSRVDKVAIAPANELPEFFALGVNVEAGGGLDGADLGDGFRAEESFGIAGRRVGRRRRR